MSFYSSYGTLGSETGILAWSRAYRQNGTKRGVIFCHGYGGYSYDYVLALDPLMHALVEAGFPCIATELGGPAQWGANTDALMTNAFSELKSQLGAKNVPPLIVSYSMGNLAAYNWLAHGNAVAAIVSQAPLVNFTNFYNSNIGGYQNSIQTAYGSASAVTSALATRDPNLQTAAIISSGTPIKLYYGDTDGTDDGVIPIANVTSFASAISAPSENIGNVSHANIPANIPLADCFNFLTSYA